MPTARRMAAIAWLALALSPASLAEDAALNLSFGTPGAGLSLSVPLSATLSARVGVNAFNYDRHVELSGVDYRADFKPRSGLALLDWYPGGSGFRVSAGLALNKNRIEGRALARDGQFEVGGVAYPADQLDELSGRVRFRSLAPYVGFGYSRGFGPERRWGAVFDAGVLVHGKPRVSLRARGPAADDPGFQQSLAAERRDLQDDLDSFRYWPVVSLGLRYAF